MSGYDGLSGGNWNQESVTVKCRHCNHTETEYWTPGFKFGDERDQAEGRMQDHVEQMHN